MIILIYNQCIHYHIFLLFFCYLGNILVNINERGHLRLNVGDTYSALPMRSWQLTDTQTNNYFLEPDFHYTVIDLDGNPSTGVIEIENAHPTTEVWSTIKAVGNGTAIVLVTYDAIALNYYKYNAKADSLTKTNFMGGEYWHLDINRDIIF